MSQDAAHASHVSTAEGMEGRKRHHSEMSAQPEGDEGAPPAGSGVSIRSLVHDRVQAASSLLLRAGAASASELGMCHGEHAISADGIPLRSQRAASLSTALHSRRMRRRLQANVHILPSDLTPAGLTPAALFPTHTPAYVATHKGAPSEGLRKRPRLQGAHVSAALMLLLSRACTGSMTTAALEERIVPALVQAMRDARGRALTAAATAALHTHARDAVRDAIEAGIACRLLLPCGDGTWRAAADVPCLAAMIARGVDDALTGAEMATNAVASTATLLPPGPQPLAEALPHVRAMLYPGTSLPSAAAVLASIHGVQYPQAHVYSHDSTPFMEGDSSSPRGIAAHPDVTPDAAASFMYLLPACARTASYPHSLTEGGAMLTLRMAESVPVTQPVPTAIADARRASHGDAYRAQVARVADGVNKKLLELKSRAAGNAVLAPAPPAPLSATPTTSASAEAVETTPVVVTSTDAVEPDASALAANRPPVAAETVSAPASPMSSPRAGSQQRTAPARLVQVPPGGSSAAFDTVLAAELDLPLPPQRTRARILHDDAVMYVDVPSSVCATGSALSGWRAHVVDTAPLMHVHSLAVDAEDTATRAQVRRGGDAGPLDDVSRRFASSSLSSFGNGIALIGPYTAREALYTAPYCGMDSWPAVETSTVSWASEVSPLFTTVAFPDAPRLPSVPSLSSVHSTSMQLAASPLLLAQEARTPAGALRGAPALALPVSAAAVQPHTSAPDTTEMIRPDAIPSRDATSSPPLPPVSLDDAAVGDNAAPGARSLAVVMPAVSMAVQVPLQVTTLLGTAAVPALLSLRPYDPHMSQNPLAVGDVAPPSMDALAPEPTQQAADAALPMDEPQSAAAAAMTTDDDDDMDSFLRVPTGPMRPQPERAHTPVTAVPLSTSSSSSDPFTPVPRVHTGASGVNRARTTALVSSESASSLYSLPTPVLHTVTGRRALSPTRDLSIPVYRELPASCVYGDDRLHLFTSEEQVGMRKLGPWGSQSASGVWLRPLTSYDRFTGVRPQPHVYADPSIAPGGGAPAADGDDELELTTAEYLALHERVFSRIRERLDAATQRHAVPHPASHARRSPVVARSPKITAAALAGLPTHGGQGSSNKSSNKNVRKHVRTVSVAEVVNSSSATDISALVADASAQAPSASTANAEAVGLVGVTTAAGTVAAVDGVVSPSKDAAAVGMQLE